MNVDWRVSRWPALVIAWVILLLSLIFPASWKVPFFLPLPYIPMGLLVELSFSRSANAVACFVIFPLIAFAASPLLAIRRPRGGKGILCVIANSVMLLIWALPPASQVIGSSPHGRMADGWQEFTYGFYMYAVAHTIAFAVCMIAPRGARRPSRKRGFPVVLPHDQTSD